MSRFFCNTGRQNEVTVILIKANSFLKSSIARDMGIEVESYDLFFLQNLTSIFSTDVENSFRQRIVSL